MSGSVAESHRNARIAARQAERAGRAWWSDGPAAGPQTERLVESTARAYTRRPVTATVPVRSDPLAPFSRAVREWFEASFEAPTDAQARGWAAIAAGRNTLIHAPTGSGKTLAAFLWALDRLATHPTPERTRAQPGTVRVLYVSPLKALTYDVERNLRAPLTGIGHAAQRLGQPMPTITVASRTGDTPSEDRREIARHPPDILITTPESLYLMLTSQAREILRGVEHVIVDEVHAIAGTKRGAHLALSLERLERLRPADAAPMQRIGLSATQRPLDAIARFLGGVGPNRDVEIVDAGTRKALDLQVVVPVDDMAAIGEILPLDEQPGGPATSPDLRTSIWPAIHPRILELIREHKSTIVFTNSRRLSERLAQRLNELAGEDLVKAHHGSIAREQRLAIEEDLKAGRLPALVATSSLELGIDMGAVDLVIQVESPTSVARGLQRVGRAGHQVGAPSKGVIFPKYRGDLLEVAVVTRRMHEGAIEATAIPRNPLDVLAQQLVAMTVMDRWTVAELLATVTRAAPYETLTRDLLEGVLGMLAGAYPSDEFAELKPRVVWDRVTDVVEGRRDARVVAVTSGGTIPDRGLYGVFMVGEAGTPGRRVGELDEEMVYELRAGMHGDVIVLGASSWRVDEIGHDRVTVTPAPGVPGKLPFWKGDAVGRPIELGRAMGAFVGELETDLAKGDKGRRAATARLREEHDLDERAAENLLTYLEDEREATGSLPTDKRIVLERFRDELGDWRLTLLTPFGGRVHAPWSMAIESRLAERLGLEVQTIWSDDGIAIRLPEGDAPLDGIEALLFPEADEIEDLVVGQVASSSLFASRFRENAARALLLPRRRPGTRTPLWQQRQRAADLLAVASRYGSFPILVETYRECLSDVFDLPALREVLSGVARRDIAVHSVETQRASPFASSLLFDYVAAYMYDGDTPLAERRAGALTLDRDLLRELLGQEELRELLDPDALADLELSLQALTDDRRATTADGVHDLLRRLGDLTTDELAARVEGGADVAGPWLAELASGRRAVRTRIAGEERWIAIEDVARYRDGVGVSAPVGVPEAFLAPVSGALDGLLARWARSHGPFLTPEPARRWGLPIGIVEDALERLLAAGTLLRGEFRPGGAEREWCDPDVLRLLRRRSLARLRREVEPVDPAALGAVPARVARHRAGGECPDPVPWHGGARAPRGGRRPAGRAADPGLGPGAGRPAGAHPRLPAAAARRAGVARRGGVGRAREPRSRRRADRPRPARARRSPAGRSGRRRRAAERVAPRSHPRAPGPPRGVVLSRAASPQSGGGPDREVLDALWDLVWAGEVTNDTFAPLRALRWKRTGSGGNRRPRAGRLTALGPPEAAGRWSLVEPPAALTPTERLHAQALALLERHGVLTREAVASEGLDGGFSAVYPVLRAMEEAGRIRRGYFVDGLGCGAVRPGGCPRSAARGPRRVRARLGDRGLPAGRGGSGQPVRRRPRLAATRRARPSTAATGGRRLRRAWSMASRRSTSNVAARRSRPSPRADDPDVAAAATRALADLVAERPLPRARRPQGRWPAGRRVAPARDAARGRVRARVPRPDVARREVAPCPRATRSSGRRPGCDRTSSDGP